MNVENETPAGDAIKELAEDYANEMACESTSATDSGPDIEAARKKLYAAIDALTGDVVMPVIWVGALDDALVRQADAQAALAAKDAEIARLESAWQVDTVRRKDGIIAQQEAENDRLRAELAAMTVERDTLAAPVLLTKNQIHLALDAAGVMPDGLTFERELRVARAIEAAVHAANPALGSEGGAA